MKSIFLAITIVLASAVMSSAQVVVITRPVVVRPAFEVHPVVVRHPIVRVVTSPVRVDVHVAPVRRYVLWRRNLWLVR